MINCPLVKYNLKVQTNTHIHTAHTYIDRKYLSVHMTIYMHVDAISAAHPHPPHPCPLSLCPPLPSPYVGHQDGSVAAAPSRGVWSASRTEEDARQAYPRYRGCGGEGCTGPDAPLVGGAGGRSRQLHATSQGRRQPQGTHTVAYRHASTYISCNIASPAQTCPPLHSHAEARLCVMCVLCVRPWTMRA